MMVKTNKLMLGMIFACPLGLVVFGLLPHAKIGDIIQFLIEFLPSINCIMSLIIGA